MALVLVDSNQNTVILDRIEFVKAEADRYFKVLSHDGNEISVDYVPIKDSAWDKERFQMFLFENPYLAAENDVFEIYCSDLVERLGWIFPITILESNENDYVDYKNLNNYKFIAYQKLLEGFGNIKLAPNQSNRYKLTDIYNDSLIICLLSQDTLGKLNAFKITDYLLSLYKSGYSLFANNVKAKIDLSRKDIIQQTRLRKRLNLQRSSFDITSNSYINSLFTEHLVQADNYIVRYVFLYQILEQLMEQEFEALFHLYLNEYTANRIYKNDLKENIINASKERELLKGILNRVPIDNDLKNEFEQECEFLFNDINFAFKNSFPDKLYDFRNLLTHRFRSVNEKVDAVRKITEIFERVVINTLLNYN